MFDQRITRRDQRRRMFKPVYYSYVYFTLRRIGFHGMHFLKCVLLFFLCIFQADVMFTVMDYRSGASLKLKSNQRKLVAGKKKEKERRKVGTFYFEI